MGELYLPLRMVIITTSQTKTWRKKVQAVSSSLQLFRYVYCVSKVSSKCAEERMLKINFLCAFNYYVDVELSPYKKRKVNTKINYSKWQFFNKHCTYTDKQTALRHFAIKYISRCVTRSAVKTRNKHCISCAICTCKR